MEVWKIIIPIVVFILCPLGIWYATKLKLKEIREKLYIYPKNGPLMRMQKTWRKKKRKTVDEGTDVVTYKKVYKFVRTW